MFLVLPAIIWYDLETGHKVTPHWLLNGAFISGLVMFFQVPLFRLEPILGKEIVGIDLLLLNIFDIIQSFDTALYVAIGIGWMVLLLSFSKRLNKLFLILGVAFSQVFFLGYVYSYIVSWSDFFTNAIPAMFTAKKYLIGGVFALFFGIIVMFYVMGFVAYLIIVVDRWGKTKIKEHDKNAKAMRALVPYIEKIGDLSLARHQLEDKGWPKEIVHEAVIRAIQVEEKIKRFFIFEKRKKINKEIAKHELISHGWSELAANNLIRRYW
ncbi:hypothetical protein GOV08_03730, partial [Candidatus Woesearchaeota archaeon]|nr:hypothetical protein [Candidatus Woesearchaeota archaeon]